MTVTTAGARRKMTRSAPSGTVSSLVSILIMSAMGCRNILPGSIGTVADLQTGQKLALQPHEIGRRKQQEQ